MTLSNAWGLQPASATIVAIGGGVFQPDSSATLAIGGATFHGRVANCVETISDDGRLLTITFTDNRIDLMKDVVFGSFNEVEILEDDVSTPGIDRLKRYVHIYPEDADSQQKTKTKEPLSAAQILQKIFNADTVVHSWGYRSHSRLNKPVYGVDAKHGKKLGVLVQEILEYVGLMMTLVGPHELAFAVKGEGIVPLPSPENRKDFSAGAAIGPETRVRVVGDRNIYQDLPIDLEPDWNRGYEAFWYEPAWIAEVGGVFGITDPGLAKARALEVTLREYCAEVGDGMSDLGKWGEVSRMEIPVWVYINDIVFKAYRVPRSYRLRGLDLESLEMRDGLLSAVESTTGGAMTYRSDDYYPDTKAYCIARGQVLSRFDPKFLDAVTPEDLSAARTKWQPVNKFNLDTKNKVVIFEEPVFVDGGGDGALYVAPNAKIAGIPEDLRGIVVPNAGVQISPAAVRASLCFEAEMFAKWFGSGTRANAIYVANLNYHALMQNRTWSRELRYASSKSADTIAQEAGEAALTGQNFLESGGFRRVGVAGTALNGAIDRVTVTLQFEGGGEGDGISEQIDYAKERAPIHYEAERELERRSKVPDAVKQLRQQRDMAAQMRFVATHLKPQKRVTDRPHQNLNAVMQAPIGAVHSGVQTFASEDVWLAGQPVFVLPDGTPDPQGKIFRGIVIADMSTGPAIATATQGIVPVRVKGPVEVGDDIGIDTGVNQVAKVRGALPLGKANAKYAGSGVALVPVRLGAGTGEKLKPLELVNASEGTTWKARVVFGAILNHVADGFSWGDNPPLILDLTGVEGEIWATVTANVNPESVDAGRLISLTLSAGQFPEDAIERVTAGHFDILIGTYKVETTEGVQSLRLVNGRYGPIDGLIYRRWFSDSWLYELSIT